MKYFFFLKVLDFKGSRGNEKEVVWLKGLEGSGMCKHNEE